MKCFYIFALIFIFGQLVSSKLSRPAKPFYDLNESKDLFNKFIVKFNKHYKVKEYSKRYEIFVENLEKINEFNRKSNLTVYNINQFSDLKYEELASSYMGLRSSIDVTNLKQYEPVGFAPASLDYRTQGMVTDVKDQGQCNSCYIFSAVGCIEGQQAKLHGLTSLSEQQALDCQSGDGCASGGSMADAMNVLAQQGGSMSEADYPYEAQKGQCRTDTSKVVAKVTGGSQLSVSSENDLKDALANNGPLSIGLNECPEFHSYSGGIFDADCQGGGKHAVLLVGYDSADGVEYWIIKNSWSTRWGIQGYMNMKLGAGICGIGNDVVLATVS